MALKYKIDKSTHESLPADVKKEYVADGDSFILDISGAYVSDRDVGPLARAHDRNKLRIKELEKQLGDTEAELDQFKSDPKARDIKVLEKSWSDKYANREKELTTENDRLKGFVNETLVNSVATTLAADISTAPELMLPHILKRISADITGDKPVTKVLDKDGKPSALTIDDLKKELLTEKAFAPIIVASRAKGAGSGSNAQSQARSSAANSQEQNVNPMTLSPAEMAARIAAKKGK